MVCKQVMFDYKKDAADDTAATTDVEAEVSHKSARDLFGTEHLDSNGEAHIANQFFWNSTISAWIAKAKSQTTSEA